MIPARRRTAAVLLAGLTLALGGCVSSSKDVATLDYWLQHQHFGTASKASPYSTDELGVDPEIRGTVTLAQPLTTATLRDVARDLEGVTSKQPIVVTVRSGDSAVDLANAAAASDDVIAGYDAAAQTPGVSAVVVSTLREDRIMRVTTSRDRLTAVVRSAWESGLRERPDRWQTTFAGGDSTVFVRTPGGDVGSATALVDALAGMPKVDLKLDNGSRSLEAKATGRDELLADTAAVRDHAAAQVVASVSTDKVFVRAPRAEADVATAWDLSLVDGVRTVSVLADDVQAYGPRTAWPELIRRASGLPTATISTWGGSFGGCAVSGPPAELQGLVTENRWCGESQFFMTTVRPGHRYDFVPQNDATPDAVQAAIRDHPWTGDATVRVVCSGAAAQFTATADGHARDAAVVSTSGSGVTPAPRDAQRCQDIVAAWDAHATR